MRTFRIYKNGNRKRFVETTSLKFAISVARELEKKDKATAEIREKKGNRWYKVNF